MEWIKKFFKEEEGTEIVEWALILGLIIILSIAAITTVGTDVLARWNAVAAAL